MSVHDLVHVVARGKRLPPCPWRRSISSTPRPRFHNNCPSLTSRKLAIPVSTWKITSPSLLSRKRSVPAALRVHNHPRSGQVGLHRAFATHGNASIITNRLAASARPLAPTSPVELWRRPYCTPSMPPVGKDYIPPNRPGSPGFLNSDFFKQQVAKQRNNNYHSSSLRTMVATSVNRTALHPGGVQYVVSTWLVSFIANLSTQTQQGPYRTRGGTARDCSH